MTKGATMTRWKGPAAWIGREARAGDRLPYSHSLDRHTIALRSGGAMQVLRIAGLPFETEALPTIKTFPVDYAPKYYIIASVFALLTTYVAGLFPARKAARIDPVEIIRGK